MSILAHNFLPRPKGAEIFETDHLAPVAKGILTVSLDPWW